MTDVRTNFDLHEIRPEPTRDWTGIGRTKTKKPRSFDGLRPFIFIVIIPVVIATVYLFGMASDRYVSEAKFIVRSAGDSSLETVTALVQSNGTSRAKDESYVVNAYINSRDAMSWLVQNAGLINRLSTAHIDILYHFPLPFTSASRESFFQFYQRMISSQIDEETGITTLSVTAFRPDDAQAIADALLRSSESLLNELNKRAELDAVSTADHAVDAARRTVADISARLEAFRTRAGFVDGQTENVAKLKTVTSLTTELADTMADVGKLRKLAPHSPAIGSLDDKIRSLKETVTRTQGSIAGDRQSLAEKLGGFEKLTLEQRIAERTLTAAVAARETALQTAQRQHLYLHVVVAPNKPDQVSAPRRLLWLIVIIGLAEAAYLAFRSVRTFALEHAL